MSKFKYMVVGMMMFAGAAQAQTLAMVTNTGAEIEKSTPAKTEAVAAKPAKMTALMAQIEKGHIIEAKDMLDKGADVAAVGADGQTALHFAARKGYIEVVKKLIREGADVNARDNMGRTALDVTNETEYTFPREKRVIARVLTAQMNK